MGNWILAALFLTSLVLTLLKKDTILFDAFIAGYTALVALAYLSGGHALLGVLYGVMAAGFMLIAYASDVVKYGR